MFYSFSKKLILLLFILAVTPNNALFSQEKGNFQYNYRGSQTNFIINYDRRQSETRSERVKIALEVNKSRGLAISGDIELYFGEDKNNLTKHVIGSITSNEDFNLKTFYFKQNGLTPNTNYYFRWSFNSNSNISGGQGTVMIRTSQGFSILPDQLFDIPEKNIKEGDTLGRVKYDDNGSKWAKIQTYYKTTVGLKTDGSLLVWGNNSYSLIPGQSYSNQSVVYEPVLASMASLTIIIDSDGDGYLDNDEDLLIGGSPQSDKNNASSKPADSDTNKFKSTDPNNNSTWNFGYSLGSYNDDGTFSTSYQTMKFSNLLEGQLGMDPNQNDFGTSSLYGKIRTFRDAPRIRPMLFKDFALTKTSVYGVLTNGDLWHWGNASGGNDLYAPTTDLNGDDVPGGEISQSMIEKNNQDQYFLMPWYIGGRFNGKKIKVISSSDNFLTSKYPNLYGKENWYDSVVAAITEDGDLFVWGQINGVVINTPLELGAGRDWSDVKVSDGILALAEDGTMHHLAIELYQKVPTSSNDTDNDGVADNLDAYKYNPQFQYDSDEDGLPDKEEIRIGTDRFNEDSDKDENGNLKPDGVNDGEDAFPLDSRYSRDDDEDGVPYVLDFKMGPNGSKIFTDDNWDRDGDQIPDGEDAHPDIFGEEDRDYDGDGISNVEEWERHLDAWNRDTDQDGVDDNLDEFPQSYFYQLDSDKDGLPDKLEIENGTNYLNPQTDWDSDGDGVKDGIVISKFDDFRNQADELYKNCSGDNWRECNGYEFFWRFWDLKYDCDGNGRITREEWEKTSSDCTAQALRDDFPLDSNKITDTDRDGIDDNLDDDDDNDGYKDVFEEFEITINGEVFRVGTNPKSWWDSPERAGKDSDYDRVPDLVEIHGLTISNTLIYQKGTDPFNVNSDDDWAWDGWDDWPLDSNIQNDKDRDKLEDWVESRLNTNPLNKDTDGDGVLDGQDDFPTKNWSTEPGKFSGTKDTDKDGLSDEYEKQNSTVYDYTKPDSDGDGYWDCECDENKFVYYTDFYGNSYWTDNWRWCNQEKENEYLTATASNTLSVSNRNKFIAAGIKTVREILDLNTDKIVEIVGFTGDDRFNDANSLRRKLEI